MPSATFPANEEQRLAVLHTLDILNDDKAPNLDHITELAQDTFAVPIANNPLVTGEPHLRFAASTCWRWLTTHWIFCVWK
ncbi:hypothetical protein QC823_06135 [Halomonas vilamensis]|uniref:Uncharacterized protein n=1 Tax=Vreelandella vilamensis TaxID=531309 RepID=A0ABU1H2P5_9GAMM|nr:hypothetical protein [Halomonas vilamensis]MDR5898565.1 hypothetical protein [Halomonas vilamensis]